MCQEKHSFNDDGEISALVHAFESCAFHPSEFRHYQHLAVAFWYIFHLPYYEASERMKTGIRKLASAYGKTGYHETITVFWLNMARNFLSSNEGSGSVTEAVNQLVKKYGDPKTINEYYSPELLASPQAKTERVEPDLKSIES